MADMALFLGALVIVYVVPGPDMILLLETGLLRGRAPRWRWRWGWRSRAPRTSRWRRWGWPRCSARIPGPSTRPGWRVAAI